MLLFSLPTDIVEYVFAYVEDTALARTCRLGWKILGCHRRHVSLVGQQRAVVAMERLPRSLQQLIVCNGDDEGFQTLQALPLEDAFTKIHGMRIVQERMQAGASLTCVSEWGVLGIRQLLLCTPHLRTLHVSLVMDSSALLVGAWQMLLTILPITLESLCVVCFLGDHQNFLPLTWKRVCFWQMHPRFQCTEPGGRELCILLRVWTVPVGSPPPMLATLSTAAQIALQCIRPCQCGCRCPHVLFTVPRTATSRHGTPLGMAAQRDPQRSTLRGRHHGFRPHTEPTVAVAAPLRHRIVW